MPTPLVVNSVPDGFSCFDEGECIGRSWGTEIDVLKGAERIIQQWEPLIYIEIKSNVWQEHEDYLTKIGYSQLASHTHNYLFGAN